MLLKVQTIALPHLVAAVESEITRLQTVRDDVGGDWPSDFDPNDIPLYDLILVELKAAIAAKSDQIDFPGKFPHFLLMIMPAYIDMNKAKLSAEEIEALWLVIKQYPWNRESE